MHRRRRELTQWANVMTLAVNEPKRLKADMQKIAPLPPKQPKVEVTEYGERLVGGFVDGWWRDAWRQTT